MHRQFVFLVCVFVVVEVDLSSAAAVTNERQVTTGRDTPVAWPACLKAGRQRREAESTQWKYAVIIDAGSSGSRVRIYRWPTPVGESRVALQSSGVREINNTKIEPGLSSAANLQRVSNDIRRLLSFAGQIVPRPLQRSSPVYLMATAGMRLLLENKMSMVMNHVDSIMSDSSFNPFHYASKESSRILSGEEEGVFAWIAVNYLLGVFNNDRHSRNETVAILEMGGASTQIAFVPKGDILADKFPVLLGGSRYPLYVHSYLYYGVNAVHERIMKRLIADTDGDSSQPIDHPCLFRGDNVTDDKLNRTFVGIGDPSGCLRILNQLVHKAEPANCYPKPCAIGAFYQPTIDPSKLFYAVGAFHYSLKAIGAVTNDGVYVPRTGFEKAIEYCTKDIGDILPPNVNPKHIRVRCLQALYAATLLTRAYGFLNNTQQIRVVGKINQQPTDWPLGAVLYEDELAAINECGAVTPVAREVRGSGASPVSTTQWTVSLALLVYTLQHIRPPLSC